MPHLEPGKLTTDIQRYAFEVRPTLSTISPNPNNRGSPSHSGNSHPLDSFAMQISALQVWADLLLGVSEEFLKCNGAGDGSHPAHNFVPRVTKVTPPHLACWSGMDKNLIQRNLVHSYVRKIRLCNHIKMFEF